MALGLLALSHLVIDFLLNVLPPLLPFLIRELGISVALAGLLASIASLSTGLGQPLFGHLVDRWGKSWMVPAAVIWVTLAISVFALSGRYSLLLVASALAGMGGALYHPLATVMVHSAVGKRSATALSVFSLGGTLGMGLAPAIAVLTLTAFQRSGLLILTAGGALIALLCVLGGLARLPLPHQQNAHRSGLRDPQPSSEWSTTGRTDSASLQTATQQPARPVPSTAQERKQAVRWLTMLTLGTFLRTQALVALTTFLPLYYVLQGHPDRVGGTMLTVLYMAGSAGSMLGAYLADRFGRKPLTVGSLILCTPAMLGFLWLPSLSSLFLVLSGLVLFATMSAGVVYGQELLPSHPGVASGLIMGLVWGVAGAGLIPIGVLADQWGIAATLKVLAWLPLIALPLLWAIPDPSQLPWTREAAPVGTAVASTR